MVRPSTLYEGRTLMGTADKVKNNMQVAKGDLKEKAGKVANDRSMQAKGKGDKTAGNLRQAGEKLKDAVKK
jgi:uncharacterized protein YjbJ (UPF0337 family)